MFRAGKSLNMLLLPDTGLLQCSTNRNNPWMLSPN